MKISATIAIAIFATSLNATPITEVFPDIEYDLTDEFDKRMSEIDIKTGQVSVPLANIDLNLNSDFYFLSAEDANFILTDVWGNPETDVAGMIVPAGSTPWESNPYAIEIYYEQSGYVEVDGAADIDYDDLLSTMQGDMRDSNQWRQENGYESIALIGWAAEPHYDAAAKSLHWAKELKFGQSDEHTLNYNLRLLGRDGVLVANYIAGMDALHDVEVATPDLVSMISFQEGKKYADFNPSIDKVAAGGIAALIAGKVIAKTGILLGLLLAFKKFGIFIVIGIGALLKGLFRKK